jgi:hypothetical protein
MYKEIIENVLKVTSVRADMELNGILSQTLTDEGYPHIHCLGITQDEGEVYEVVIMDGLNMNAGPIVQFKYDFQDRELQIL